MLTTVELISCGIFVLLVIGVLNRGRKRVHIPLMASAFVADMAMLLYIEFTRQAIERASTQMTPLMGVHVLLSVIVIGLYVGQIVTGIKKARGRSRPWHGKGGVGFLLCRFGNLITSFMVTYAMPSGA